jgi:site-specific recombinase XerD
MNLTDDFAAYLSGRGMAARTVKSYCDSVSLFARWFSQTNGQKLDSGALTQTDAREYRQHLIQRGQKPASINSQLAALRTLARWWDTPVSVAGVKQQPLAPRWLDKREQAALLREAERQCNAASTKRQKRLAIRDRAIILFLMNTGLRVSELCDLAPGDVEMHDRSGSLTIRNAKGEKTRAVALNREARAAIADLMLPLLLKPGQVQRKVAEVARLAGVPCTPHTLRHTFAHSLFGQADTATIAALLGHSNLNTTRRYILPGERELQQAVDSLA